MSRHLAGKPAGGPDAPFWVLAPILRVTIAKLLIAAYRIRVRGRDNIPLEGGYIFAGNHVSYLDPALIWCVVPRPTHFVAKSELFDNPLLAWAIPRVWAFPINRGSADRVAIQRATELLTRGEPVGMFPEGTRRRPGATPGEADLGEAASGVAFIALRAGVPVVPVGISGTERALPVGAKFPRFPRVTIRFGEPVRPEESPGDGRKEKTAAMTAEIMRRIAVARDAADEE